MWVDVKLMNLKGMKYSEKRKLFEMVVQVQRVVEEVGDSH